MKKDKKIIALAFCISILIGGFIVINPFSKNKLETITIDEAISKNNKITELNKDRILIIYFSRSGNTEAIANFIHESVGGELLKLETKVPYPSEYNDVLDQAQKERANNARPELKTKININDYDAIFVGYPLWCYDIPMAVYTFFDSYDFKDKIVIPFMTHGTSGESGTFKRIDSYLDKTIVLKGFNVYGSEALESKKAVNDWLKELGFKG